MRAFTFNWLPRIKSMSAVKDCQYLILYSQTRNGREVAQYGEKVG